MTKQFLHQVKKITTYLSICNLHKLDFFCIRLKCFSLIIQVKPNSSDSGHSSPSSSIDKTDKEFIPIPLSEAKPRSRPKSQHIPKTEVDHSHRFSYQANEYHKQNSQVSHNPQVYRVDNITYADLDPKAFMIPQNKVLPSRKTSSSDSRSTYAEISVSKSQLI